MKTLIVALLLQSYPMVPRTAVPNPTVVSPVPKKLQADYGKIWARFAKGKEDANVLKDADKLLKKNPGLVQLIIVEAYIDLYNARAKSAEARLERVFALEPGNRIALSYLAEFAFAREEYGRANDLYARLLEADPSRTDVETKRQKALLLATEDLLHRASKAEAENRLSEAESLYLQALYIAPNDPSLHDRLGVLFTAEKKWDLALEHFRAERELGGPADETDRHIAETLVSLGRTDEAKGIIDRLRKSGNSDVSELVDIGRWGKDIEIFHKIQSAPEITREQLAAVIVRYFPQVADLRRTSQVVTDIQDSWARADIQTVVGIGVLDARSNHTFQPRASLTRSELALALARLERLMKIAAPAAPPVPTADVAQGNAIYKDVQLVVGQGLMSLDDSGSFNATGKVSGLDAIRAVEHVGN